RRAREGRAVPLLRLDRGPPPTPTGVEYRAGSAGAAEDITDRAHPGRTRARCRRTPRPGGRLPIRARSRRPRHAPRLRPLAARDTETMTAILLDDRSTPPLRTLIGALLARAQTADFAISRMRLDGLDLGGGELARLERCRVLLGRLDARTLE